MKPTPEQIAKLFTPAQRWHFRAYEAVRSRGAYNMFDTRARISSGLTPQEYGFVMDNYSELADLEKSK